MADRIEVDPDKLDIAADSTEALGESILSIGERLRNDLAGLEDESTSQPWGDDSMGSKFINGDNENGYGSSKPNLLDGVDAIGGTFTSFAVGQRDAANQLRTMDGQI
ncbi:hypothetical protein [Nocardia carnea]|uniref:WXG100 family type VII secretion target n=1 Tax=Nocardia carnea TaxID=37328 RepID=A0ABW7TYR4_9NOCA|nr:hypothetical protein [Nocardia carnea]